MAKAARDGNGRRVPDQITERAPTPAHTRVATVADAGAVAQTLREFNAEFDEPAPQQEWLAERVAELLRRGDTTPTKVGGRTYHGRWCRVRATDVA